MPVSRAILAIQAIATDDELKELQRTLIAQPNKGDLIQGTGGLRKIRMALGNQGKSGGARVTYFWQRQRESTLYWPTPRA
ncbi:MULTISPECIES: hypothetical protein [unclassified Halomonas]|uniref:hypothetical protein n=1 Tax=unclassified Halomonas TaxID=2609666 RepID=UPI004033F174